MDIESILDSGHETQPNEKQVDADFFNGSSWPPVRDLIQSLCPHGAVILQAVAPA